ncbi:agmatine deiminase family protein [Pedobacter alpinus]|uniref:Agmatine deiminase family protein n=1 Tax=Pedobacter alpinus TaxID=1590643 RepID=A0ABW5TST8_9SPHI
MISDFQTNTVYFSDLINTLPSFKESSKQIISTLNSFEVKFKFLPETKDIWARDYMPIQINSSEYIEYRYDPDYLQGNSKGYRDLKSYPEIICDSIGLKTIKSSLIMDGGNFIKSSNCIIFTDKLIKENCHSYSRIELIKELQKTFKVDRIIFIPWDKNEEYGHADGMVRFVDDETVLLNYLYKNDSDIINPLKKAGLKLEYLEFSKKTNNKFNWAYINFLQTEDLIIIPKFGIDEDYQAYEQINSYYPNYKGRISQVDVTEFVKKGGALNCISWTTKE